YSLGIAILALFLCQIPFLQIPVLRGISDKTVFSDALMTLIEKNRTTKLKDSPLFKSLNHIDDGKFKAVYSCLNDVFTGLTRKDDDKRMSVHQARENVQPIKALLPMLGEGFECPCIEDIVHEQRRQYGGSVGTIEGVPGLDGGGEL
ncbi:hypothetical protein ADUPG1_013284, partial [Aduncisulcus paluster]